MTKKPTLLGKPYATKFTYIDINSIDFACEIAMPMKNGSITNTPRIPAAFATKPGHLASRFRGGRGHRKLNPSVVSEQSNITGVAWSRAWKRTDHLPDWSSRCLEAGIARARPSAIAAISKAMVERVNR
ncbi:hypothetical protein [Tautonia marina]|uniref:hypothetical protein n=1 Tax=Tautonia marina TaxID=2653855 RepID=UPI0012605027|nr:hypothetical protein [Tautonia marina]